MVLSKSFGYALRGILYVALMKDENRNIRLDEMAHALRIPRHFLGKIMKGVVKAGILDSSRGQQGGFFIHDKTLSTPLVKIILLTEGATYFNTCLLSLRKCNSKNPCPLHHKVDAYKEGLMKIYKETSVGDLLNPDKKEFIQSIAGVIDDQSSGHRTSVPT
ncbi:MAG: Rrf2 family transcriptional regulator [Chitinophagaceae bacterium]|nr:Rrf2 family transcriptional regulator [Chitinophagaceae bacterium]